MKKMFRKNQVVVSALAVMIAVAGYLTYAGREGVQPMDAESVAAVQAQEEEVVNQEQAEAEGDEGEVQEAADASKGVDTSQAAETSGSAQETGETQAQGEAAEATLEDVASLDYDVSDTDPGEAVLTNGVTVSDFLAQVRMNREQIRGKNKDTLLEIINNDSVASEEKQAAIDNMVQMTEIADQESAAENMLQAKGFDNAVVSITDGQADVVICRQELSDAERAQVEDIVKRKTDIDVSGIVITLMEVQPQ